MKALLQGSLERFFREKLSSGFEDRGEHQCHSQPHEVLIYEC